MLPTLQYRDGVLNLALVLNRDEKNKESGGVEGGWQLDHIKPVSECFDEGVPVEEASDASNLRMLPWLDNLMRNYK